jgi:Leucine-rich repeat (LRR) protein
LHNQNLINLANQILEENSIFPNYIDKIIEESIKDNKENEEEALKKLNDEYSICLEEYIKNDELCLKLRGAKDEVKYPKLGNEGFKYISQIRFKDLIEINLSNNNISDISYLNNMLLPHLEILNFSDNQIANITPVANLVSKNLFEIYLQNNQIEDITPFENAKFSIWSLKILRLDGNKFFQNERENQGKADIQKLVAKFGKRLIYEIKSWDDFNKKYNSDVDENEDKLDLGSKRNSDIIVDLLPLLTYPNNIKILILDNDKITDANYLTMMPLYKLTYLDLSLNYISNINFVKKLAIKCKDLKILYLHDNKINDLTPLMSYKNDQKELIFEKLETLTLKNNILNLKDPITNEIIIGLVQKGNLTLDYKGEEVPQIKEIKASLDSQIKPPPSEHGGEYAAAKSGMKQLAGPSIICP